MKSTAHTVDDYIQSVPVEHQADMAALTEFVRKNIPKGYQEAMTWGMPTWEVPLEMYPNTYNKKPLMYLALASQKNNMAFYLTSPYIDGKLEKFQQDYKATGKKLDMGKSCIRFKKLDDLALDVLAKYVSSVTPAQCIQSYESIHKN